MSIFIMNLKISLTLSGDQIQLNSLVLFSCCFCLLGIHGGETESNAGTQRRCH